MKLKTLIDKLESARQKYMDKWGVEPEIFNWDNDLDGLSLCAKLRKQDGATTAIRPYMDFKKVVKP